MQRSEGNFEGNFSTTTAAAEYLRLVAEANGYKKILLQKLQPKAGETIVDIGCGTGQTIGQIARIPGIRAIGVDLSHDLLKQSPDHFFDRVQSNATSLGLTSGLADAILAERAIQWMDNPLLVLQEAHRLLKPDGRLVIAEVNWQDIQVTHPNTELTNRIMVPEHTGLPNPRVVSQLPVLFKGAGFSKIEYVNTVDVLPSPIALRALRLNALADYATESGIISRKEREDWLESFNRPDQGFKVSVPVVISRAIK